MPVQALRGFTFLPFYIFFINISDYLVDNENR